MERGKDLTPAERTAMVQDIGGNAKGFLGIVHGNDGEGLTDIEFPSIMHAAAWLSEFALWPVSTLRDSISGLYDHCVIQINLYDYANRRGYMSGE